MDFINSALNLMNKH